jgi:hypothetical protein
VVPAKMAPAPLWLRGLTILGKVTPLTKELSKVYDPKTFEREMVFVLDETAFSALGYPQA